jgi:ribosomal protein L12E/L44/L45/RPP1/RPP2
MTKLIAAIMAGMFSVAVAGAYAADKGEAKGDEKKSEMAKDKSKSDDAKKKKDKDDKAPK